eukprot:992-Heterococcus_DN1.PRE.3
MPSACKPSSSTCIGMSMTINTSCSAGTCARTSTSTGSTRIVQQRVYHDYTFSDMTLPYRLDDKYTCSASELEKNCTEQIATSDASELYIHYCCAQYYSILQTLHSKRRSYMLSGASIRSSITLAQCIAYMHAVLLYTSSQHIALRTES